MRYRLVGLRHGQDVHAARAVVNALRQLNYERAVDPGMLQQEAYTAVR